MARVRRIATWLAGSAFAAGLVAAGLLAADRAYPPPLAPPALSPQVEDRDGRLLRAYAAPDGYWRLAVSLDDIDPDFVRMLVAYEDKRFFAHRGVDPLAVARAARQLATNGRIVSGASTITMQLARLMEPRSERSFGAKLRQALRAIQIERRLSKREILERYLTLAPYGANVEGLRAASLAWFGKEPRRLGLDEAALLVALPQSPERRRPDRPGSFAQTARDRVLERMAEAGVIAQSEVARAARLPVPGARLPLPALAPHAADTALRQRDPNDPATPRLTLRREVQRALETVAREAAAKLGPGLSVAIVAAEIRGGALVADVGSANYFDPSRRGWIDMTTVPRSPGSTLKPFIYGLAFEEGLVAQETMIEDRPASFSGYRPRNFDLAYQGDVTIREALQLSLNVPAIRLLDAVGPQRLVARMRRAGVTPALPRGERPGLAIGLGGAGVTLKELVRLYAGLADRGRAPVSKDAGSAVLLDPAAAWQVADILAGVAPPQGAARRGIAYKTGTSYGYRDAWSVGFDGAHVIGVWVGRPDGAAVPGLSGYASAAPVLFEAFAQSGLASAPLPPAPPGAMRMARADLPVTQRRFAPAASRRGIVEPRPEIVFPPDGARVELGGGGGTGALALKLQGGRAPFRWLANGEPLEARLRRRETFWTPSGAGFSTLTVIDAAGRTASVKVFVE
jgi:penicillin-binding protein 1C